MTSINITTWLDFIATINFATWLDIVATLLVLVISAYLIIQDGQPRQQRIMLLFPLFAALWNLSALSAFGYRVKWTSEPGLTAAMLIFIIAQVFSAGKPLIVSARLGLVIRRVTAHESEGKP